MLSWAAQSVVGVDIDPLAVKFAEWAFPAANLKFDVADITRKYVDADIYVCFEVLEHLEDPAIVLERFNPLIWSMPVDDASQFHVRGYSVAEIDTLTGGAGWVQSREGFIVERGCEWFEPLALLGVRE
jgi:hypothetical protein